MKKKKMKTVRGEIVVWKIIKKKEKEDITDLRKREVYSWEGKWKWYCNEKTKAGTT